MKLLHVFSVMMTIFVTNQALICYHCPYCDDIFQAPYVMERDCTGMFETPSCEKVVYELDNSSRGVIVRRCHFTIFLGDTSIGESFGKDQEYPLDYVQQYYMEMSVRQNTSRSSVSRISVFHCQTDYCNSTSITSGSLSMTLIFILPFLLL